MNHRQMAGRLTKASCEAFTDQLAQSRNSAGSSLAHRNIHRYSECASQRDGSFPGSEGGVTLQRHDEISIQVIRRSDRQRLSE
jgi:hypothetical protein